MTVSQLQALLNNLSKWPPLTTLLDNQLANKSAEKLANTTTH